MHDDDTLIDKKVNPGDASTTDASADLKLYPGSVGGSILAKLKRIDARYKTRLNQCADRDQVVCETLQDCFDLLVEDTLEKNEDLNDLVQRWEIQDSLLAIAVDLDWLAPQMAPNVIAWGHREWLMKLLEGRIAYFESRALGEPLGALDKPDYVVLKVPETDPLFQSEDAREALKQILGQPLKMFDTGTLKLHASSAYGVPPEMLTPEQLGATLYAFGCRYRGIKVTMSVASSPPGEDSRERQADVSKSEQAELPMAMRPPAGCISRPVGSSDRLLAKLGAPFSKLGAFRSASAPDIVEEELAQPMDLPSVTNRPAPGPRRTESRPEMEMTYPQGVKSAKKRGRRPNPERRDAIHSAISKHGGGWREHLTETLEELDGLVL